MKRISINWNGQELEGEPEALRLLIGSNEKKTTIEKSITNQSKRKNRSDNSKWSRKEIKVLKNAMQHNIFVNSGLTYQLKEIIQQDITEHCKKHRSFSSITGKMHQIRHKKTNKKKRPKWTIDETEKAVSFYRLGHSANFVASNLYKQKLSPILRSNQSVLQKIYAHTDYRQNPGGLPQFRKEK